MSFAMARPDKPSEFSAVLLRDVVMKYDYSSGLPIATAVRSADSGLIPRPDT